MRLRRLAATALLPVLLLAACGDDSSPQASVVTDGEGPVATVADGAADSTAATPDVLLARAATAAQQAESAKFTMSMTMSGMPGMGPVTFGGDGVFDYAQGVSEFSFSMAEMFKAAGLPISKDDATMEMRVVGTDMYMRFPMLTQQMGGGIDWLRVPVGDEALGELGMGMPGGQNPADMLYMFGGGSDVEEVGQEKIRGVNTTQLRGNFDLDAAAEMVPAEQRSAYESAVGEFGGGVIPVDVWVGDDGLVYRFVMTMSGSMFESMGAPGASMVMEMEFFDYGTNVSVSAPGNWTDFSELGLDPSAFGG